MTILWRSNRLFRISNYRRKFGTICEFWLFFQQNFQKIWNRLWKEYWIRKKNRASLRQGNTSYITNQGGFTLRTSVLQEGSSNIQGINECRNKTKQKAHRNQVSRSILQKLFESPPGPTSASFCQTIL